MTVVDAIYTLISLSRSLSITQLALVASNNLHSIFCSLGTVLVGAFGEVSNSPRHTYTQIRVSITHT